MQAGKEAASCLPGVLWTQGGRGPPGGCPVKEDTGDLKLNEV